MNETCVNFLECSGEGDNGLFITQSTQSFNNVFQLVGMTILLNFDWLIYKVECSNVLTTNFNLQKRSLGI